MRDHGGDRDWPVLGDVVGHGLEFRKRRARDRFDEDVDDAAAGEPDREGVVVADSVALEPRRAVPHNVGGQFVDRALDAAARHRPAHRAVRRHHHRRSGRPRGGAEGAHDGADTGGATGSPDRHQLASTSRTQPNVGSNRDTGSASGLFGGCAAGLCPRSGRGTRHVRRGSVDACRAVAQGTRRPVVHQDRRRAGVHAGRLAAGEPGDRDPRPAAADGDRGDRGRARDGGCCGSRRRARSPSTPRRV